MILYPLLGGITSKDNSIATILEKLRIVRCSDGIHRSGRECYFLNDDAEPDVDLFSDALALEEETQLQIQEEDGHEEHFYYVAKGVYSSRAK